MSLFGSIMGIQDAINRLPQLEHQINKLEREEEFVRNDAHSRLSFIRRAQELHKQIDDHRKRTDSTRVDEANRYRKKQVLEQIEMLKHRLSRLAPERDRNSSANQSRQSYESLNDDRKSDDESAKRRARLQQKQSSIMYDGDDDSDSEADVPSTSQQDNQIIKRPQVFEVEDDEDYFNDKIEEEVVDGDENKEEDEEENNESLEEVHAHESVVGNVHGNTFVVLKDLKPSMDGDLEIHAGEVLHILETRSDGWWLAKNRNNDKGLVPKTFLKHVFDSTDPTRAAKTLGVEDSILTAPQSIHEPDVYPIESTGKDRDTSATSAAITFLTGRRIQCLGDALRMDNHLSYACHLAPRLSHSNIAFHDLFWNYQHDQVRKRSIRISRILRVIRLEGMPHGATKGLIRLALFDESKKRGRQIVSNVHTIQARIKGTVWNFINKEERMKSSIELADTVIRSNYALSSVVLIIEASVIVQTQDTFEEKSLGIHRVPLLNDMGFPIVASRTYVEYLKNENIFTSNAPQKSATVIHESNRRILFKIMDVSKDNLHLVDSMPDVLLFNAAYLQFFYYYRRRAGTILIRDNCMPLSSEMVSDPLLAVFPEVCGQPDIMDALLELWSDKKKTVAKKTEIEQAIAFFQLFIHTAFFLHQTFQLPVYEIADDIVISTRHKMIRMIVEALRSGNIRDLISRQTSRPINIFDYSLDLFGSHSID